MIGIEELFLLGTAIVFTALGYYMGQKSALTEVTEAVVDSLIEQGYIKTRGQGDDLELLKHWEK